MKSLNSMTFQVFHDLYEPFRGWGRGMTIERGVGDLKQKCPLWGVGGGVIDIFWNYTLFML